MYFALDDELLSLSRASRRRLTGFLDDLGAGSSLAGRVASDTDVVDLSQAELAELVDALGRWHADDGLLPRDASRLRELAESAASLSSAAPATSGST